MSGRGRRRRNRRPANPPPAKSVSRVQLHRELEGFAKRPPTDPPPYCEIPWNTIEIGGTQDLPALTSVSITVRDISQAVQLLVGLTAPPVIKVFHAILWLYPGKDPSQPATAEDTVPNGRFFFYETSDYNNNVRRVTKEFGTTMIAAAAGYNWPYTDQKNVLDPTDNPSTLKSVASVENLAAEATCKMVWRVRVLWRLDLSPEPLNQIPLKLTRLPSHGTANSGETASRA